MSADEARIAWYRELSERFKPVEGDWCTRQLDLDDLEKLAAHFGRLARGEQDDKTAAALRLAKEATNGWGCYAKRQIEHDEITRLHRDIARLSHD